MLKEMAQDAIECFRTPGRRSVWSSELGRYVCPDSEEGKRLTARDKQTLQEDMIEHPPLNKMFKLVFLTAVIGTLFFFTLCIVLTFLAGKEPPPLFEKVIMGSFDLVKIGVGAAVGLLSGRKLQAESSER